jgi:hypothetical protein
MKRENGTEREAHREQNGKVVEEKAQGARKS